MVKRNRNLSPSLGSSASGIYRATVTSVGAETISLKVPRLSNDIVYNDVPFYGDKPSVNDEIIVGFLNGNSATPVAIITSGSSSAVLAGIGSIHLLFS